MSRLVPWVTPSQFQGHVGDTNKALGTIIAEVRKGNEDVAAIREAVGPLVANTVDLVATAENRRFRHWIYRVAKAAGRRIWAFLIGAATILAALYAAAAIDPHIAMFLKGLF